MLSAFLIKVCEHSFQKTGITQKPKVFWAKVCTKMCLKYIINVECFFNQGVLKNITGPKMSQIKWSI
jgi:hypothetical protein